MDGIPKRITVYELGGVTSFLKNLSHYVAYIPMKDEFLLFDGIPQENPVLKKYIRGEISLLCFFPVEDDIDISCSNANSLPTSNTTKTSSKVKANSRNGNESASGEAKDNSYPRRETSANHSKAFVSDQSSECIDGALLAKAFNHIETENYPVSYSKPRGKNYRCRSKGNNLWRSSSLLVLLREF